MPTTSIGTCTACGYTGPCWTYLGPQYEDPADPPVYHYWNCPACHSTKTSPYPTTPPQGPAQRRSP